MPSEQVEVEEEKAKGEERRERWKKRRKKISTLYHCEGAGSAGRRCLPLALALLLTGTVLRAGGRCDEFIAGE